jgi:hypothetical protein
MFALGVLQEFGCDGPTGPCGSIGRFTSDWWLINLIAAVLIALALLLYRRLPRDHRRLLRDIRGVNALEIGGISDATGHPRPHHKRAGDFR